MRPDQTSYSLPLSTALLKPQLYIQPCISTAKLSVLTALHCMLLRSARLQDRLEEQMVKENKYPDAFPAQVVSKANCHSSTFYMLPPEHLLKSQMLAQPLPYTQSHHQASWTWWTSVNILQVANGIVTSSTCKSLLDVSPSCRSTGL